MDAAGQYALAYSLTTAAGVRAVLSLALVDVATHLGLLHPPTLFAWLGSPLAMWSLLAVAAVELLGDKIPLLDHALHVLQIVVKPAAAAIIVGGTVHPQSNDMLIFLMVIGALNALGVHAGVMTVRGASTLTTGGLANPVVSVVEDAGTIGTVVLAFVAPVLAAMLSICAVVLLLRIARPRKRNGSSQQQERESAAR